MRCSACREEGHTKSRCSHKDIRGKFVYQIICLILSHYETTWGPDIPISRYIERVLRELNAHSFSSLIVYVESTFGLEYSLAYASVCSVLMIPVTGTRDKVLLRKAMESTFGVLASSTHLRTIIYAGLPDADVHHIMNSPEIQSNQWLKRSIWKYASSYVVNYEITHISFKHTREVILTRTPETEIKVGFDQTLVILEDEHDCPICMEPFTVKTFAQLNCGHNVCVPCMNTCERKTPVHKSVNCCLCRVPVTNIWIPMNMTAQ
jgi:hypothetical protein